MLKDLLSLASHGSLGFPSPIALFVQALWVFVSCMRTCLLVRRV